MEQAQFLAYAGAALAALVGGVVLVVKKRRATGVGLILVGSFLVLLPVGIYVMWFTPLGDPTSMTVYGLDPRHDQPLTVKIRNTRDIETEVLWSFRAVGGPDHVVGVFEEQHPQGVDTTDSPQPIAGGEASIWHLSTEDVRYDLVTSTSNDWYRLETQVVVVHTSGSGPDVRIPFPRSAFDATALGEGEPYSNDWAQQQWADFYKDISLAHVSGDTITAPTNRGGTAEITLDDGTATVTVDPQPR